MEPTNEPSFKKSNVIADRFRDTANKHLCNGQLYNALILNNMALCYAETEDRKSLSFAGRSAVYLELKQYDKCLENIQLAKQQGYPSNKIQLLTNREKKCCDMIKQSEPKEDPWDFFKLSHPANKKIPFIVNCLQMRTDKKFGRGIYTNRDLKAGEIIAIEEPFLKFMNPEAKYKRCANCLKSNMLSLLPSSGSVMFCSTKCVDEAQEVFKDDLELLFDNKDDGMCNRVVLTIKEFMALTGNFEELRKAIEDSKNQTIFCFNFDNPHDPVTKINSLKSVLNLQGNSSFKILEITAASKRLQYLATTEEDKKFLDTFIVQQTLINQINTIGFKHHVKNESNRIEEVAGVFPFSSLINHSCNSNVHLIVVDNKLALIVIRPIAKEMQIFRNYGTKLCDSADDKENFTMANYDFVCDCKICEKASHDWGHYSLKKFDRQFKTPPSGFTSISDAKVEIDNNWAYIIDNIRHHPCYETVRLVNRNIFLLDCISSALFTL